jgi:hypothetical protein
VLAKADVHERPDIIATVVLSRITSDPRVASLVRTVVHEVPGERSPARDDSVPARRPEQDTAGEALRSALVAGRARPETIDLVLSMVDETVDNIRVAEGPAAADRLATAVPGALRVLASAGVIERYVREAGDAVTAGLMLNHVVDAVARAWADEGETAATTLAESFDQKGRARDVR